MKNYSTSPLIIVGMHRSGTSMLSLIMDLMGIYTGFRKEGNNESKFYLRANNWILQQAGCNWASSHSILDEAMRDEKFKKFVLDHMKFRLNSILNLEFKGVSIGRDKRIDWGWKDPRNTLTYDIWDEIYPDNKVISIRRHGLDVAQSLFLRSSNWMESSLNKSDDIYHHTKVMIYGYSDSYKSLSIESALKVWEDYESKVEKIKMNMEPNRFLQIRYEDLLIDTENKLEEIQDFTGRNISNRQKDIIRGSVKPERAFAYKGRAELHKYLTTHRELFNRFGYHED